MKWSASVVRYCAECISIRYDGNAVWTYSDVIASILESTGYLVTREYYVNDTGSQINILGNSLFKRYQQLFGKKVDISSDEYPGEYLIQKFVNNDRNNLVTDFDLYVLWYNIPSQIIQIISVCKLLDTGILRRDAVRIFFLFFLQVFSYSFANFLKDFISEFFFFG